MSMSIALPHFDLSAYAWKTTKVAVGGAVFIAMSLPIAFPARGANPAVAAPAVSMVSQQPAALAPAKAATTAPAAKAKAKASAPAKVEAAQVPNKKPLPKNA